MKNKKLIYVLIPLVLFVWGVIIYRVFNTINNNESPQLMNKPIAIADERKEFLNDTFSLRLNYRDPFLGKLLKTVTTAGGNKKKELLKTPLKTEAAIVWPVIVYGGVIKNQNSNKLWGFVQINGQVNIVKEGDVINEIQVKKIMKDSIEVQFGKQKKFVYK